MALTEQPANDRLARREPKAAGASRKCLCSRSSSPTAPEMGLAKLALFVGWRAFGRNKAAEAPPEMESALQRAFAAEAENVDRPKDNWISGECCRHVPLLASEPTRGRRTSSERLREITQTATANRFAATLDSRQSRQSTGQSGASYGYIC